MKTIIDNPVSRPGAPRKIVVDLNEEQIVYTSTSRGTSGYSAPRTYYHMSNGQVLRGQEQHLTY